LSGNDEKISSKTNDYRISKSILRKESDDDSASSDDTPMKESQVECKANDQSVFKKKRKRVIAEKEINSNKRAIVDL